MNSEKARIPAFVKNDIDLMRFLKRIEKRTERYPNWRQVFWDCSGVCQYPVDGGICGETKTLEYHEIYEDCATPTEKELGQDDYKLYQTVLVCNYHHASIHGNIVNTRRYPSMSATDIEIEMLLAGGGDEWKKKFNIIDRKVEYDFTLDTFKCKNDLQYSENSQDNGDK